MPCARPSPGGRTSASRRSSTASTGATSAARKRCRRARACRPGGRRSIAGSRSRRSATCRNEIGRTRMLRRLILATAMALLSVAVARAQATWPDRPIKFIVHVAAGGGFDLMARVLAERLSQQLGQPVVIENNGPAAGIVAARTVARAEPDGYTLLFVGPGFASVPSLHKHPP